MKTHFTLAVVGRPNVGKSTLFNRFVGQTLAIVNDRPGVTRDWRTGYGRIGSFRFRVLDTPGFSDARPGTLERRMWAGAEDALRREADVLLMLLDARIGVLPEDVRLSRLLRCFGLPLIVAGNKAENLSPASVVNDLRALATHAAISLSAAHGSGMPELCDALRSAAESLSDASRDDDGPGVSRGAPGNRRLRIAVAGRPNVGKSTLVNRLIGTERLLTGPEAGLTRDSISVDWMWRDATSTDVAVRPVTFWDTAGLRRKAGVSETLEKLSVADALRTIRGADVVILMVDATSPFDRQELRLAGTIGREGRAMVIGINKWDLQTDPHAVRRKIDDIFTHALHEWRGLPIITMSATSGRGVGRLMPAVRRQYDLWNAVPDGDALNGWLRDAVAKHPPPREDGRPVHLSRITQIGTSPPVFAIRSTRSVASGYLRYLASGLRSDFGLAGVPLRIAIRTASDRGRRASGGEEARR